ncbi:hypothetical protein SLS62_010338 [Diatrype stigma]|uniref:Uncharacterized protein n=1 Tax=Diatrype stigma TaxID=117547 RepID=A0AAN9UIF4_9PEZI
MQQLSLLNDSFTPDMSKQLQVIYDHSTFQSQLHAQSLRSDLIDGPYGPSEEMDFNDRERTFLPPQDRWHQHLRGFGAASAVAVSPGHHQRSRKGGDKFRIRDPRPLVWISGDISRRNVSWVSSFSVDLISFCHTGVFRTNNNCSYHQLQDILKYTSSLATGSIGMHSCLI